jgi:hypothetical protein
MDNPSEHDFYMFINIIDKSAKRKSCFTLTYQQVYKHKITLPTIFFALKQSHLKIYFFN